MDKRVFAHFVQRVSWAQTVVPCFTAERPNNINHVTHVLVLIIWSYFIHTFTGRFFTLTAVNHLIRRLLPADTLVFATFELSKRYFKISVVLQLRPAGLVGSFLPSFLPTLWSLNFATVNSLNVSDFLWSSWSWRIFSPDLLTQLLVIFWQTIQFILPNDHSAVGISSFLAWNIFLVTSSISLLPSLADSSRLYVSDPSLPLVTVHLRL